MNTTSPADDKKQYRLAIRRPVTMAMLFLTLIVFGVRSYQNLSINLMPDISYPTLTVRTTYDGAAPEDVAQLVTRPLEEMLSIVSGLVEVSSVSSANQSEVILEFAWGTNMITAQQDVRDRLDLFDPPRGVTEKPVILRFDPTLDPVMRIAITPPGEYRETYTPEEYRAITNALTNIRDAAERHLKSDLEAEAGIAQVAVKGGQEPEIQVLVDAERLKGLGLTVEQVVNSLAQQNINLSGGRLIEGRTEYLVRTLNEFQTVSEIGESLITAPDGNLVMLSDFADVFMGTKDRKTIVHRNGREAVALEIFKEGDANTVQVANRIKDLLNFERPMGFFENVSRLMTEYTMMRQPDAEEIARMQTMRRTLLDRLPANIEMAIISDQSRFIVDSIDEVREAVVLGGLLALMVLFLFLRDLRTTMIIGIAIPISVVATFVPMFMRDISLNIMSLGGLALGVGMLVDNSIVVLESIFRCREEGDDIVDAAERGTKEVGSAVTASTLTTISVFLPIAFVEGIAGQLFGDLALAVTFSLLASLLVALNLIPLIASRRGVALQSDKQVVWVTRAMEEARGSGAQSRRQAVFRMPAIAVRYATERVSDIMDESFAPIYVTVSRLRSRVTFLHLLQGFGVLLLSPFLLVLFICQLFLQTLALMGVTLLFGLGIVGGGLVFLIGHAFRIVFWLPLTVFNILFEGFRGIYKQALLFALRFNAVFLLIVLGVAVHAGFVAMELGRELIPPVSQGEFGIRMEALPGTRLEETEQRARRIEQLIQRREEIDSVTVEIGQEGARIQSDRGENVAEFTILLKNPEENAHLQDAIIESLRQEIHAVSSDDITFTLPTMFTFKTAVELHIVGDDLEQLRRLGENALPIISAVPGVEDADLSAKPGYPEIIVEMDRELLASRGLSPNQVAERVRTEVQGDVATRFSQRGERVDIRVRTDQELLSSRDDLIRMSVAEGGGPPIPLRDVARISVQDGPSEIRRVDQRQVVLITANVSGRDLGAVSRDIRQAVDEIPRPANYYFELGGQDRELQTAYASLQFALLLAVFLVYVVMACQFESIWHPALVMFSVPLAFIGVIYAMFLLNLDLSVMVFLGGIVLAGIVVNDAIVLVDYINQLRAKGMVKREAIIQAGMVRLRPIMMTTVTTVLGLIPMILSSGSGAEMRRPMAATVMSGLVSATILTLLIIPMAYDLFARDPKAPEEPESPNSPGAPGAPEGPAAPGETKRESVA